MNKSVPVYVPAFMATYGTEPWRNGQAELTWVAHWLNTEMVCLSAIQTLTKPGTD